MTEADHSANLRQPEQAKYVGYFNLLKRAIHVAGRPAVQEHLRALFAMFQDALGHTDVTKVKEVREPVLWLLLC